MLSRSLNWSGYALGFALGGFFDGILLHQILQWHHLLSALEGRAFADIRVQILADGLFHALMYLIAAAGLVLLFRARRELAGAGAGSRLIANALIGFGLWHIVDAVLVHWITGLHRIRMDSRNPLFWDLLWFFVFGALPLLSGLWLRGRGAGPGRGLAPAAFLSVIVLAGGLWASRPPPGVSQVVVHFGRGIAQAQVFAAAGAVGARVVWSDSSGQLWVFDLTDPAKANRLYGQGALLVARSFFPAGCLSWSRT